MTKISVIVPVYNVEQYLNKCLNSLVNQTLKDIEIIIVNDGTKDNSQNIIDKYVKQYNNVKSYIKENGGLSSARNYGLQYATGEYIAFVDSDDWVELDMYEKMYEKAKEKNYDMVVCDLTYIYSDYNLDTHSNITNDITDKNSIKKSMINIYPAAWNKIYNKSFLDKSKILFKENVWFEDVEFLYRLFPYINTIGVVPKPFYNYLQRDGAITSTFDKRLFHYIENFNGIVSFYKENNFYEEYKKELEYTYVRYLYATFIKRATNYSDKEMYNNAVTEAIKNVNDNFPHYRKNNYFYRNMKGLYLILFNRIIANLYYRLKKVRK